MSNQLYIRGQQAVCPFCRFDQFTRREIKLNTTGMSLLGLDWADKDAARLVCHQCGHIQMFLDPGLRDFPS